MSQSWSELLVRSELSEWLVDDAVKESKGEISSEIEEVLRSSIQEKTEIMALKKCLTSIKRHVSKSTFEALKEELDEIREDCMWAKSSRGKYVSEIQDWAQTWHSEMRAQAKFDDLAVGAHASLEVVYVCGKSPSTNVLDELIQFLQDKEPPRKILTNVIVEEGA